MKDLHPDVASAYTPVTDAERSQKAIASSVSHVLGLENVRRSTISTGRRHGYRGRRQHGLALFVRNLARKRFATAASRLLHRNIFSLIIDDEKPVVAVSGKGYFFMSDKTEGALAESAGNGPITIKKYANRRLYNTATSCYVTLDYLARLVKAGEDFAVYDAKTGEDITRSVLTHIIVEEESKGQSMLPVSFLRHLISFYGDSLQVIVPRYLDHTMQMFARNQEQMRSYMGGAFDGFVPFGPIEEMGKHQMAIFEHAMRMFSPFHGQDEAADIKGGSETPSVTEEQISELRSRVNQMQKQLDDLASRRRAR